MHSELHLQSWLRNAWQRDWHHHLEAPPVVVHLPHTTKDLGEPSTKIPINGEWWWFETKLVHKVFFKGRRRLDKPLLSLPTITLNQYRWYRLHFEAGRKSLFLIGYPEFGNCDMREVYLLPGNHLPGMRHHKTADEWQDHMRPVRGRVDIELAIADPAFWHQRQLSF